MSLNENVIINMANNYCCRYSCYNLNDSLRKVIRESNGSKRAIYELLVRHFGRIMSSKKSSFVGELNQEFHYTLINDINKDLFIQIKSRHKYTNSENIFVTFLAI